MAATLEDDEKGIITDFKAKAREFWTLWERLESREMEVANQSPDIKRQYAELLTRGENIRTKVEWITGLIDKAANAYADVKDWLTDTFGLGDLSYNQVAGLGVIPLIPVAIIGASVAAIGYWIKDAYQFNAKLDEIKRLERRGIPPDQAARIVERTFGSKGLFGGAGNIILPLALGAGVLFLMRKG